MEKVKTNVLLQNCFVREFVRSDRSVAQPSQYLAVDEKIRDDGSGVDLVYHVEDYPITPEYVNSFVDSSDYHNDPLGAMARASLSPRVNLGDITALQEVAKLDATSARELYSALSARFAQKSVTQSKSTGSPENKTVSEVNNNE